MPVLIGGDASQPAVGEVTQAELDAAIAALVDSSPAALDTLNELAAALGDDANFATTVTNALAAKADADDLGVLTARSTGSNTNVLATDAGGVIEATAAITVSIQTNATEAIPTGSVTEVAAMGAGVPVTIDAVAGVTLNGVDGGSTTIDTQYASAALRKTDTNAWIVVVGGAATVA